MSDGRRQMTASGCGKRLSFTHQSTSFDLIIMFNRCTLFMPILQNIIRYLYPLCNERGKHLSPYVNRTENNCDSLPKDIYSPED